SGGVDPEELWELGEETGYCVEICWSGGGKQGDIEVLFRRDGSSAQDVTLAELRLSKSVMLARRMQDYANNPEKVGLFSSVVPELRSYLKQRLPEHLMPSLFVDMSCFPLTPNGKLDRKALPEPVEMELEWEDEGPRTAIEEIIGGICAQVLRLERV